MASLRNIVSLPPPRFVNMIDRTRQQSPWKGTRAGSRGFG